MRMPKVDTSGHFEPLLGSVSASEAKLAKFDNVTHNDSEMLKIKMSPPRVDTK